MGIRAAIIVILHSLYFTLIKDDIFSGITPTIDSEGLTVTSLSCSASRFLFSSLTWRTKKNKNEAKFYTIDASNDNDTLVSLDDTIYTNLTLTSRLNFDSSISDVDAVNGIYRCVGRETGWFEGEVDYGNGRASYRVKTM